LSFNLRRFYHNLKVWEPPERPWHSIIITQDLRGVLKDLETDKAIAINGELDEEYMVDARNRVDFTAFGWGVCQMYVEWAMPPLEIFEKRPVVPESLRTWYLSKTLNKWVQAVPGDDNKAAKIVLTQTEYYIQKASYNALDRAMYDAVKNNNRSKWMWVFATVVVTLCLMLTIGYFTSMVNSGKAVNPFSAIGNAASSVGIGGKK
jgi:hypothetical protein